MSQPQSKKQANSITLIVALAYFLAIGLGAVIKGNITSAFPLTYLELGIHAVIFAFLFKTRLIQNYFRHWPLPHRIIFIAFFVFLLAGQYVNNLWLTYPFTAHGMYSKPEHKTSVDYIRLKATDQTGAEFFISPEKIVPTNDKATIISQIKRIAFEAFDPKKSEKFRAKRLNDMHLFLGGIGKIYNARHPNAPITSVKLLRYNWNFRIESRDAVNPEMLVVIPIPEGKD